tara:strand:+ start:60 stop:242 length:183 start_codon:yes stop_codon:yes gene_type:complete
MKEKELEQELRNEWRRWQGRVHEDDMMSFVDFAEEIGTFKGYAVELERNSWGDYKIKFKK